MLEEEEMKKTLGMRISHFDWITSFTISTNEIIKHENLYWHRNNPFQIFLSCLVMQMSIVSKEYKNNLN